MSQSEAGPSRRRRPYVSRACNSCRRRRCKCDGVQPVCGSCSAQGYECTWGAEGEESSRPVTKQFVESLRVKIHQLESEIEQLRRDPAQIQSTSTSPTQLHPDPTGTVWGNSPVTVGQPLDHPPQSHLPQLAPVQVPVATLPPAIPAIKYQYIFNIDTALPLDEQYPSHRASLTCQWNKHLPDLAPIQLSRSDHDTILFRVLSYGASCSFGLLPDLFLAELLECLAPETHPQASRYYTPILHCSLLAFGAGLSDNSELTAKETREKFATHAKAWLDNEFNNPSPSLMLSLVLLSEYHSGIGERNTGHMYMGMAVRIARTSKPLLDPLTITDRLQDPTHPLCSSETGTAGRHLFKASRLPAAHPCTNRLIECLMALEINGPSELPVPQTPITCPMAIEPDSRPPLTESVTELLAHPDYPKHAAQCLVQMCKLMVIASRMLDHPMTDKQAALDIHLQLETWFNTLPEGVLIRQRSTLTFPPVLALHITYWWLILHSHLPLADQISLTSTEPVHELAIKMCSRATEKLVQLFNTFDKQFGLQYFPRNLVKAIYSCGSALVVERDAASSASRKKRAMAIEGIEACVYALKVVGRVWPVAVRMGDELEGLAGVDSEMD